MSLYTGDNLPNLDINQLMNTLPFLQEKWELIGIKLGVSTDMLDLICQEAEKAQVIPDSLNTFCCIKMLTYWFQNSDNVSADIITDIVSARHVGLIDKVTNIRDALTSNEVGTSSSKLHQCATSPPEGSEVLYVEMKTNICKELNTSHCNFDDILLFLQNSDIEQEVLENVSNFVIS